MNLYKIQLSDQIYTNFTEFFMQASWQNTSLKMLGKFFFIFNMIVHEVMMILLAILWFFNVQRILCSKEIPLLTFFSSYHTHSEVPYFQIVV